MGLSRQLSFGKPHFLALAGEQTAWQMIPDGLTVCAVGGGVGRAFGRLEKWSSC